MVLIIKSDVECNNCSKIEKVGNTSITVKLKGNLYGVHLCKICKSVGFIDMDKIIKTSGAKG